MKNQSSIINSRPNLSVFLTLKNSVEALDFYQQAFGAELKIVLYNEDKTVAHSEFKVGNAYFGIAEQSDSWGNKTVEMLGGSPIILNIEVEDVDNFCKKAIEYGAKITQPVDDQFYGARSGRIVDPYGFEWIVSTTYEEMDQESLQTAMENWMKSMSDSQNA